MIYTYVTEHDMRESARIMNRYNSFSYEGWGHLYNYLYDLSEDIGEDIELDIIAICCDYTEFDSYDAVYEAYHAPSEEWDAMDEEEKGEFIEDYLQAHTSIINFEPGCIIIADF